MFSLISTLLLMASMTDTQYNPDYIYMVEQAILAPSGHNTQPWLFRITDTGIEIHPDLSKTLPVVDPDNRELFISLGCALENLCIAAYAKGYSHITTVSAEGVIAVDLFPSTNEWPVTGLVEEIPRRQTNRAVYDGKIIPPDTVDILTRFISDNGIPALLYRNSCDEYTIIKQFVERGNRIQMQDKAFKQELRGWMRYNKKHSASTLDGLSYDVFGAPNLPLFISKPAMRMAVAERRQVRTDDKKIDSSSHIVILTLTENTIQEWIELGRKLQLLLLEASRLGIAAAHLNQPAELPGLRMELAESLGLSQEIPAIILRIGYADPAPYSKRKDIQCFIIE